MPSDLAREQFILVSTYKRDGTPVATPVWVAPVPGGRIGFTTSSSTWKVPRLRHDPRVLVQPCSRTGTPVEGSVVTPGRGEVVTSGPLLTTVRAAIKDKYGVQVTLIHAAQSVWSRVRRPRTGRTRTNDCAIVITLAPPGDAEG